VGDEISDGSAYTLALLAGVSLVIFFEYPMQFCGVIGAIVLISLIWEEWSKPKYKSISRIEKDPDLVTSKENVNQEKNENIDSAEEIILGKDLSWNEFNSLFSKTNFPFVPKSAKNASNKSLLWKSYKLAKGQSERKLVVSDWIKGIQKEEKKRKQEELAERKTRKQKELAERKAKREDLMEKIPKNIEKWPSTKSSVRELPSQKRQLAQLGIQMKEFRPEIIKREKELEKLNKEAKISSFNRFNFQRGHRNPSPSQKEKVWNESKTVSLSFWMDTSIPPGKRATADLILFQVTACNNCGTYSQDGGLSFWWKVYPELKLDLLCDKCAENEGLVEEKQVTESRSRNISQEVRDKVWNRDGGKCVDCGSNENLEFDHIIPHSKGGANTYRNIQLLCEKCNRSKSDNIG
tara:strand:- start:1188 stop:2408 length:1221 start_codon:yes stop_codon:yes gene_type:complete